MSIKLSKIQFAGSRDSKLEGLSIEPGNITLLVGPNNSGKSQALREIESYCCENVTPSKVIKNIQLHYPESAAEINTLLNQYKIEPENNELNPSEYCIMQHGISTSPKKHTIVQERLENAINTTNMNYLCNYVISYFTIRLDGKSRFLLTEPRETGDLQRQPENHLMALFLNTAARNQVSKFTEDAFGLYFVIDPTEMKRLRIRMSETRPTSSQQEQGLDENARRFHNAASEISMLGDGIQAFVGLLSAVASLDHKIILIDEPEAFLHPPLARRLGANLAKIAAERNAHLIVATHSADFVMGCIESTDKVEIVRLTYENKIASSRKIEPLNLKSILNTALLRSSGVIRSLFHRAVIVCEGDSDRAFYDEINRRLISVGRGIQDALFINAPNLQAVDKIVKPLRELGIPAVALVDLDFLNSKGDEWSKLIHACQINELTEQEILEERKYFAKLFSTAQKSQEKILIKNGGVNNLKGEDVNRLLSFLEKLAKDGLFLVPIGELESWLSHFKVSGHGPAWLINMFELIGNQDEASNFLSPSENDIWKFLDDISAWISKYNPAPM